MNDFLKFMDEVSMVDIKPNKCWFTWANNRRGQGLDRFFASHGWLHKVPFKAMKIIRWSKSDHDVIVLDTMGRKSKDNMRDSRLMFKYKDCFRLVNEVKSVTKKAWMSCQSDVLKSIDATQISLERWQHSRCKDDRGYMNNLIREIYKLIDEHKGDISIERLREARVELGSSML